jgi:hypothetical protein
MATKQPEAKGTHSTLHCSRCGKNFDADTEDFGTCVGPAGTFHDLHGNNDGPGSEQED